MYCVGHVHMYIHCSAIEYRWWCEVERKNGKRHTYRGKKTGALCQRRRRTRLARHRCIARSTYNPNNRFLIEKKREREREKDRATKKHRERTRQRGREQLLTYIPLITVPRCIHHISVYITPRWLVIIFLLYTLLTIASSGNKKKNNDDD